MKATVPGVFKDLKFKTSAKLRQPKGQTQDDFNFGLSFLKGEMHKKAF